MKQVVNKRGFSLIELLAAILVAAVLMALVLPSLTAVRTHQRVESAASQVLSLLEQGRARAIATRFPVYVLMADQGTSPKEAGFRAITLSQSLENPVAIREWLFLPRDVYFVPAGTNRVDWISDLPWGRQTNQLQSLAGTEPLRPPYRVVAAIMPDGSFTGSGSRAPVAMSVGLRVGEYYTDAGGDPQFIPVPGPSGDESWQRIDIRPLTGIVGREQVLPQ